MHSTYIVARFHVTPMQQRVFGIGRSAFDGTCLGDLGGHKSGAESSGERHFVFACCVLCRWNSLCNLLVCNITCCLHVGRMLLLQRANSKVRLRDELQKRIDRLENAAHHCSRCELCAATRSQFGSRRSCSALLWRRCLPWQARCCAGNCKRQASETARQVRATVSVCAHRKKRLDNRSVAARNKLAATFRLTSRMKAARRTLAPDAALTMSRGDHLHARTEGATREAIRGPLARKRYQSDLAMRM